VTGIVARILAHQTDAHLCAALIVARRLTRVHLLTMGCLMHRRDFLGKTAVATTMSLAAGTSVLFDVRRAEAQHELQSDPLSTASMTFGAWRTNVNPPTDRHVSPQSSPGINWHPVTPQHVTIKAGGTVSFVIAGLHQIAVYDSGIQPSDINVSLSAPDALNLIDDPNGRLYRGLNPVPLRTPISVGTPPTIQHVVLRDRVEVLHFANPGTYLVICTVRTHFVNDQMWGWVKVLPSQS
jgi:plastocyanin